MKQEKIEFVIADDPELDDLLQEAWIDNELVADIRRVDERWKVRFFSESLYRELSWEALQKIYLVFSEFIKETDTIKVSA